MAKPRTILWDVESSHNVVATFQLKQQDGYIPDTNILTERHLICAAWKEQGAHPMHSVSLLSDPKRFQKDIHDDYHVIKTLHAMLSEADVLVAHNGDDFDLKLVKGRMLIYGFAPLPPIPSIDTLKVARQQFLLNANNLGYLGQLLHLDKKQPNTPGLWLRVLQGDKRAISEMQAYNKQDVILLEKVFLKLQPYVPNHISRHLFGEVGCPRCGSLHVSAQGKRYAVSRVYQRMQCQTCGGWYRLTKALSTGDPTRTL